MDKIKCLPSIISIMFSQRKYSTILNQGEIGTDNILRLPFYICAAFANKTSIYLYCVYLKLF